MIFRILGWLRHFAAAEYWRLRAIRAEQRQEAEALRNREREDMLATIYVQGMGIYGVAPRRGHAVPPAPRPQLTQILRSAEPFNDLGPVDKMEFETNIWPDAQANGITLQQAKQDFATMIANRNRHISDEMYS